MATASELLSYRGDAALGSGSNPQIPVGATVDLDIINRTGQQLMMQNMAQNKEIYDQKLKERDQMLSQISSGDIKVGDLLEEDMPVVREGLEGLDKAWEEMIKKGKNDLGAQQTYKKALREAQDRVTQAQGRKLFYDTESQQLATEKLPRKQSARKQNLEGVVKGGFWKDLTPYQQTQDLDIDGSILSTAANVTEQFTDPKNPLIKGKRTVFDYEKTKQANEDNFLNDVNKRYDQEQLMNAVTSLPPKDFAENITAMNNRILEYNKLKNLQPGQPGYVTEIEFEVDPQTNKAVIKETLPDFSAKYTLTRQKPFGSTEMGIDENLLKLKKFEEEKRQAKAREGIAGTNAAANLMRARSYSALQNKKLSQMDEDEKRVMGIWPKVISKVKTTKSTDGSALDVVWAGDLPKGYSNINGLDAKGQPIRLTPFKGKNGELYYKNNYYFSDGSQVDLRAQYNEYKAKGGKGSYDDLRQKLLKSGDINLEIVGTDGVADFNSALETARSLSNKGTTKGEEPIFSESETVIEQ